MKKIKENRKNVIVVLMLLSVIAIVLMTAGCGVPNGFHEHGEPSIIFVGEGQGVFPSLRTQFPELEHVDTLNDRKDYFLFDGRKHFILIVYGWGSQNPRGAEVFVQFNENEILSLGRLVDFEEWVNDRSSTRRGEIRQVHHFSPFLLGEYLYYRIRKQISITDSLHQTRVFVRNEFFRFCFSDANNERISLIQYIEALQAIDSNWIINPEYEGERYL